MDAPARSEELHDAVRAARELAHAACYLADIAARVLRRSGAPEHTLLAAETLEGSIRAAETAFALDSAYAPGMEDAAVLWLAVESIAVAEETIDLARGALESILPVPLVR